VEESDISTIRDFYDQYTEKYGDITFGYDVSTVVFHCIDDEMMNIDGETMFRSSVCDVMLWILCFDLG
jgi:hypothetical protein